MAMIVGGFAKHLGKNPPPDEEIRQSLLWLKSMVDGVLEEDASV